MRMTSRKRRESRKYSLNEDGSDRTKAEAEDYATSLGFPASIVDSGIAGIHLPTTPTKDTKKSQLPNKASISASKYGVMSTSKSQVILHSCAVS